MDNPKKVLIIDDDPFIADMYVLKFREEGYTVESVLDGSKGIEKVKEFKPDIVLLDIVMPAIDGLEVLKKIKSEPGGPETRVILLTNLGQKEDVERGMKLGADDYVIKAHFTPSEVVEKVRGIFSKAA